MRRKEYAVSLGLATPGRGRMSVEALAAIEKARAEGMTFDDDAAAPKTPKSKTVTVKREKSPVVAHERSDSVMADTSYRYPKGLEQMFVGYDSNGKKHVVSGRNACTCGYSLVGHTCDSPSALIGSPLERINVVPQ